jgi:hypothetical protein
VNWEWIVHCAIESKNHVVIVSRDTDYGAMFGKEPVLNDWLAEEFHDRVSQTRKAVLTHRLTEAFDLAGISVTSKEKEEEEEFLVAAEQASREDGGASRLQVQSAMIPCGQLHHAASGRRDGRRRGSRAGQEDVRRYNSLC